MKKTFLLMSGLIGISDAFFKHWKFGGNVRRNCGVTDYICDLDGSGINNNYKGTFEMAVKDCDGDEYDSARITTDITGDFLYQSAAVQDLDWHLHSWCGPTCQNGNDFQSTGTSGHYDPDFKCGGASSNKLNALCTGNYPTAKPNNQADDCEKGDLSCKIGSLTVNNKRIAVTDAKDRNPARNADFSEIGQQNGGSQFSTVVFHVGPTGTDGNGANKGKRLFGCRIKQARSCKKTWYVARFNGRDPINYGVKGKFYMSICNDGSYASYEGDFDTSKYTNGVRIDNKLKWHLHSAYNGDSNLGNVGGTGGHYDPLFACGGASTWKTDFNNDGNPDNDGQCAPNYPNVIGHELGDLSGKNGLLESPVNNRMKFDVDFDFNPPRNADYDEVGSDASGMNFASIVLHGEGGARAFGAQIQICGPSKYYCKYLRYN